MDDASYPLDQLNSYTTGIPEGSSILLLHGWGSSSRDMEPLARALARDYAVTLVDLPGHGDSPPPETPWGIPEFAELVSRFIRENRIDPVTIIGHSNGGRIALYMGSDPTYRSLIKRLVLISPSGITPTRSWNYYFRSTIAKLLKAPFRLLPRSLRERYLDWLRTTMIWRALGSSDYRSAEGVMRETFVRTVNHYLDHRVDRIDVPTLIFRGDQDTAVSHRQVGFLKEAIPNAGLVELPEAGHYGHLDSPGSCIAAIRYFMNHTP
jgi:pimeloyl-ACP methyl ester carboxylesterase